MSFSFAHSIIPMSELRADPSRVKRKLRNSPVVITNKGKPDFGVCDLDTLAIATQIKELRDLLEKRAASQDPLVDAEEVFRGLDQKYGF